MLRQKIAIFPQFCNFWDTQPFLDTMTNETAPSDHPATATTEQLSVVLGVRDDGWGVLAPFIACLYFRCRMGLDRHIVGIIMWFYNTYGFLDFGGVKNHEYTGVAPRTGFFHG